MPAPVCFAELLHSVSFCPLTHWLALKTMEKIKILILYSEGETQVHPVRPSAAKHFSVARVQKEEIKAEAADSADGQAGGELGPPDEAAVWWRLDEADGAVIMTGRLQPKAAGCTSAIISEV